MPSLRRLFVDKITSIGAVPEGDNPEAEILLFKAKPHDTPDEPPIVANEISKDGPDRATNRKAHILGHDLSGLPDDTREAVEKDLERLAALEADLPTPDPIAKADPEVQAEIRKQADRIVELEKKLADESARRELSEYTELAKAHKSFEDDNGYGTAGEHLRNLAAAGRESLDWLIGKVSELERIAKASDLFRNVGVSDPGSAASQIEALSKEKMKDNPDLTPHSARALVRKERPDLKEAERAEREAS